MPFEFKPQHAYDLHIAYQALQPMLDKGPASNDARSKIALWQADKALAKPNLGLRRGSSAKCLPKPRGRTR